MKRGGNEVLKAVCEISIKTERDRHPIIIYCVATVLTTQLSMERQSGKRSDVNASRFESFETNEIFDGISNFQFSFCLLVEIILISGVSSLLGNSIEPPDFSESRSVKVFRLMFDALMSTTLTSDLLEKILKLFQSILHAIYFNYMPIIQCSRASIVVNSTPNTKGIHPCVVFSISHSH
ncbi:CLUMA_CG005814, isoform A [Clunio marinus]|uniref:CLUMA_CG005814, isoform A n=1 Tax=Clunio marinus TaxID=568069 RepID=A0A1J1HXK1_9DIPT|nr:CLUMA_CG005814, isoform A [Clunio marinus]